MKLCLLSTAIEIGCFVTSKYSLTVDMNFINVKVLSMQMRTLKHHSGCKVAKYSVKLDEMSWLSTTLSVMVT